ncbi:MAG: hypothetical protein OMOMHJEC_00374 [Xanthomonadales bacterium]|nr:hypothetical protein [Xanthomonadales bacterium]
MLGSYYGVGSNYAFKPIAEQALRSNQTIVPQRLNAALAFMRRVEARNFLDWVVVVDQEQLASRWPHCARRLSGLGKGAAARGAGGHRLRAGTQVAGMDIEARWPHWRGGFRCEGRAPPRGSGRAPVALRNAGRLIKHLGEVAALARRLSGLGKGAAAQLRAVRP